jgi:urease accessory protein
LNPLALLLADSRFPSGSYAHSLGLEQAVNEGLRDVPAFMHARQRLAARADARFAVEARRAALSPPAVTEGAPPPGTALSPPATALSPAASTASPRHTVAALEREWAARTPSAILRDSARRLGAQLLRSAAVVWPGNPIAGYRTASRLTPRPLALGVVAAAARVSDEETALLALYDDAATVASAALKLLPLDPAVTARWLAELAPEMAASARAIAAVDGPFPSPAAVAIELSAPVHLEQRERLFAS